MHGGIAVELKCKAKIMDAAAIDRTLVRIAHETVSYTHLTLPTTERV